MSANPPLVVFSDDWGRHPSSCQHLVRQLLPRYDVCWFDTIGTRPPRFDRYTVRRAVGKVAGWLRSQPQVSEESPPQPRIVKPLMWPSFRNAAGRQLNQRLLHKRVEKELHGRRAVFLTTIPIVADLVGAIPAERWIYYCVDDFSQWPGLDGETLRSMENEVLRKVDRIAAVSERLQQRIKEQGRDSLLLTHGVDADFWIKGTDASDKLGGLEKPVILFWGLIDARLNADWMLRLSEAMPAGTIALVGPRQNEDPRLAAAKRVRFLGPMPFHDLPALARAADVLVMPYADLPVTRAMQPLKFKEYLATGRPVVASRLPATEEWSDAADLVCTVEEFVAAVARRVKFGFDPHQFAARGRLRDETWAAKARELERLWLEDAP